MSATPSIFEEALRIETMDSRLGAIFGTLAVPERGWGAVVFAQCGGTGRDRRHHHSLATSLQNLGLATLAVDLFSPAEERAAEFTSKNRFDVSLMTDRLIAATDWLNQNYSEFHSTTAYFATGAAAAAALNAAADRQDIAAVVSCGGLPILAGSALKDVASATLLIVGELDSPVIDWNVTAFERLGRAYRRELIIVPSATNSFEEPGAFEEAARLTTQWFVRYLGAAASRLPR
jgi:putative phosphoribosyl transferase